MVESDYGEIVNRNDILVAKDGRVITPELKREIKEAGQSWSSLTLPKKLSKFLGSPNYLIPNINDKDLVGSIPKDEWLKEPGTECKPAISYCTWSGVANKVDIQFIKKQVEAFKKHDIRIDNFIIDDGWFTQPGDWLSVDKKKFPHGLEEPVQLLKQEGIKPWLWLGPYNISKDSQLAKNHPDWLAGKNGKPISFGFKENSALYPRYYILDPRVSGAQDYLKQVRQQIKEWGFEGIKLDYLSNIFLIPGIEKQEATELAHQILKDFKDDGFENLASGTSLASAIGKAADHFRVSNDSGLPINMNPHFLQDKDRLLKEINFYMIRGVIRGIKRSDLVRKVGLIPNPDMLYFKNLYKGDLRRLIKIQEYSIEHGGDLVIGDDPSSLNPKQIEIIKRLTIRFDKEQEMRSRITKAINSLKSP